MANWESLPDVLINLVFKLLPKSNQRTGRLVCKHWRDVITNEESRNKTKLRLVGKEVSLYRVHQLFPNLKNLTVQLHYNTGPSALFLWQSLESVAISTRTRIINGHEYSPTVLLIDISTENPELLQVYYKSHSPVPTCTEKLPGHTEFELRRWERNWELGRDGDGFQSKTYVRQFIPRQVFSEDEYNHNIHQCNDLCNEGFKFSLKGVGRREQGSIVHQAFGVASKPHDWDAEAELLYVIGYMNILARMPFYSRCSVMACDIYGGVNGHLSKPEIIAFLVKNVVRREATLLVPNLRNFPAQEVFHCSGGRVVRTLNCPTYWTYNSPPLLPEHGGFEELVRDIEQARKMARQKRKDAKKRRTE